LVEPEDLAELALLFDWWNVGPHGGWENDLMNQLTLVVERGDRVVGCISSILGPAEAVYVDNLVVEPGPASARLAYVLLLAMERVLVNLGKIRVLACISIDRPQILAYAERLGYQDFGLHHVVGKTLQ
jgi:hypothetical protein